MAPGRWQCPCFQAESEEVVVLEYSHCNLDDVPAEVFTFERTLEELYLDANQIKDLPRALFHCHGLRKLVLSDNEIQSVPPAIASLINLEEIDISKNGVLEIPDNIKGCKCLSIIEASVNPLGRLPEGFTQLTNLSELYLNDTFLEYLPANFGRLCHLKILELRENHLKVLPKSMVRLTELTRLDIGQNDFSELPEVVGALLKLVELWCDGNRIAKIPAHLGHLKKLSYLDASKNKVQEVSAEMDGCLNLTDLTLSSNKIKHLPHTLGNLKKLLVLRVDNNHMASLPPSLGNLQLLEELVVSFNVLSSLPASLGLLRLLHTLIADDNCLEDLPQEIGSCVNLSILSVRNNRLSLIPDELGHICKLRVINLVGNRLTHLPFSIAKLPYLHALWLAENQAKPLIPLQSDVDQASGQRVLTCFMLPQSPVDRDGEPTTPDSEAEREVRQQIKFASDIESDRPGKLVRAPTPYPKELKAHARHARNFVLKKLEANGALPLDKSSMSSPDDDCEGEEGEEFEGQEDDVDDDNEDSDQEEKVVTANQRTAVREARVTRSPKDKLPTHINFDLNSIYKGETIEDVLPTENICCNGGVSGRAAPLAVVDSSPSLSPSSQAHPDNRVIYANTNTTRLHSEMEIITHPTHPVRPQSRSEVSPNIASVLPSVHGQLSPDSDVSSLMPVQCPPQGPQRSPRGSLASSPHALIPPTSLGKEASIFSNPSRVPNNIYPACLSPQGHGGLLGGDLCELPYGGGRAISGLPPPSTSQQGPIGSNRMTACSGIAWYTEAPPLHHQAGLPLHHQHSMHHIRQAQPPVDPLRPYSRGSYCEMAYPPLMRAGDSNTPGGIPRRGSPISATHPLLHSNGTGTGVVSGGAGSRWPPNTGPVEKRNSFPLARQSSADLQVAPLHHPHIPSSCHPPSCVADPYRGGSRGSSRSSSPLTTFTHHLHHHQQASYAVDVRGSPPPMDNPLPLPPKPRAMSSDGCRTLPHLPARAQPPQQQQQQHNMASLNRQCLRSGGEQYAYCHYPLQQNQQQWRGSPVSSAVEGVAPDVNLNPWPHPLVDEVAEAVAMHSSPSLPPQSWKYTQVAHQGHHSVFPVVLDRCNAAPDQLGFRIERGVGTPRNITHPDDQNFYVTQVLEKSPASAALQPGDKILQVNGVDLCGLDHMQALDTIRSAGPSLSLLISRGR